MGRESQEKEKMKLLAICPDPDDSTSFYRGMGPLNAMEKVYKDFSFDLGMNSMEQYNWSNMMRYDALFIQRPCNSQHLHIIQNAKKFGIPVWVDYDDLLVDVPSDNPTHNYYSSSEVKQSIVNSIRLADAVSCSTKALTEELMKANPMAETIPNAFNNLLFSREKSVKKEKLVVWRGSDTHTRDLLEVADQIVGVALKNPEWKWAFIGWEPWFITERLPSNSYKVLKYPNAIDFMIGLRQLNPSILIVPLSDNRFNRSKSKIACIEGAWAGAITVSPEWLDDCFSSFPYEGVNNFYNSLNAALNYDDKEGYRIQSEWGSIVEDRLLTEVNEKRMSLLKRICKRT